jgi:surface antigen
MDQVMGMARRKLFLWVIGAVSPVLVVVILIVLGLVIVAGAVAGAAGGSSGNGSQSGSGVSGAMPISSPSFQAILHDKPGTVVVEYPGNNVPPPSLVPYALPGITVPVTGYPTSLPYGSAGGYGGQCTYWSELNWIPPAGHLNARLTGNAYQLAADAQSQGIQVASTPALGELVVWGRGGLYDPYYGHVAVVVGVNATNRTYVVSEMNYLSAWSIDYRVVCDSAGDVMGFIPTGLVVPTSTPGTGAGVVG